MSRGETFIDYYALLGVKPDALAVDIRAAFMRQAKEQHPDAGGILEQMQLLNKAYATLKDTTSRRAYDRLHGFHTGTASIRYRGDAENDGVASDISDEEMDDFIDQLFAEYSAKPPKQPLHKKASLALRFRKKQ